MIPDSMPPDATGAFGALRRFEDPRGRYSEELLDAPVGTDGLGILTSPLGRARSLGVVLARSPGPEQGPLRRLDALAARELARRGFPVLRVRAGIGRECVAAELSLSESLAEVEDAAAVLRERVCCERVALVGAVLGAAPSLLAAARLEGTAVALVCPVVSGAAYLRDQYRHQLFSGFVAPEQRLARREPFEARLERGPILIRGLLLTRAGYEELAALELGPAVAALPGELLLLDASRDGEPGAGVLELAPYGRRASVVTLRDPLPVPFGEQYIRPAGERAPVDTRILLDNRLAAALADWAEGL
jgi:hypothetical protein